MSISPIVFGENAQSALPPDFSRVEKFLKGYLRDSVDQANAQSKDLLYRCQYAAQQYETTRLAPNFMMLADSLDYKLKINESSDQVDDITALFMDVFTRDGEFSKVIPGPMAKQVTADVVHQAIKYEFECSRVLAQLERATRHYSVFPFAGVKAVREYKDGYNRYNWRHINPQCFVFSDVGRPIQNQFSVHEIHFFTKREMRRSGFKNLDSLGSPDGDGKNTILANTSSKPSGFSGNSVTGNDTHKIWESWIDPPFFDQIYYDQAFTEAEFYAWAQFWQIPPEYFSLQEDQGNFFRFYASEEGNITKITPNYLATPKEHPYRVTSYNDSLDEGAAGSSQVERADDLYSAQDMVVNNWFDNLKMIGNQSLFYSARAGVNSDELQKLFKPRGLVKVPGNENPNEVIMPWSPGDISAPSMIGIQWLEGKIQQRGVNDVMRGESQARTATASRNDNARGQTMINSSANRFVRDCILPATKDVMRMIIKNYTADDWMRTNGEKGAVMVGAPPMTIEQMDNHFVVAPVGTFDFMNQANIVMEVGNLSNVFGAFLAPDQGQRAFAVALSHTRVSKAEIEMIMGSKGDYTKVDQEIQAMVNDPWTDIEVKMSDDHQLAISAVMMTAQGNPMTGKMPMPEFIQYPSVIKYLEQHQMFLMAEMQMQSAMQDAKARTPNGNPKQMDEGKPPSSDEGKVRSSAQQNSPIDQMTQPTGRAA